jgi:hypothetical protein
MRVELRLEARHDLLAGALFYERQREGLGDYLSFLPPATALRMDAPLAATGRTESGR